MYEKTLYEKNFLFLLHITCNYYKFVIDIDLMKTNYTETEVISRLQQCNVKPSLQRIAILKYVLEHREHPSVDTVYDALVSAMPTLSKTTVYNTLSLLEKEGAIQSVAIDDKMIRFDGDTTSHAHFFCEKCRKIFDIAVQVEIPTNVIGKDFLIMGSQIYYKGLCPNCKNI